MVILRAVMEIVSSVVSSAMVKKTVMMDLMKIHAVSVNFIAFLPLFYKLIKKHLELVEKFKFFKGVVTTAIKKFQKFQKFN